MSWSSKLSIVGFLGAAVAVPILSGCGSSAEIPIYPGEPFIPFSGRVGQVTATSDADVSSQPNSQQVQVSFPDNAGVSASLPADFSLTQNQQVALINGTQPIFDNTTVPGATSGPQRRTDQDILVYIYGNSTPHDTGVSLTSDCRLSGPIVVPDGHYTVYVPGPMVISGNGGIFSIQSNFTFDFWVRSGVASLPRSISGEIPVNGGNTLTLRVDATLPSSFGGGSARLEVDHENGMLQQTHGVDSSGFVEFHDLVAGNNTAANQIPPTGVSSVRFTYDDHL